MRVQKFLLPLLILLLLFSASIVLAEHENAVTVTAVDREAGSVTVAWQIQSPATLVLEVLEDHGERLTSVATLRQPLTSDHYPDTGKYTFHTKLPEYFQLEARLEGLPSGQEAEPWVDMANLREVREMMERTVNDWSGQTVLNFDRNAATNYGVLQPGVRLIREGNGLSVSLSDDESGDFALSGTDDRLSSLGLCKGDRVVLIQEEAAGTEYYGARVNGISASPGYLLVDAEEIPADSLYTYVAFDTFTENILDIDKSLKLKDMISGSAEAEIDLTGDLFYRIRLKGYLNLADLKNSYIAVEFETALNDLHVKSLGSYSTSVTMAVINVPGLSIPGVGGVKLELHMPIQAEDTGVECTLSSEMGMFISCYPARKKGLQAEVIKPTPAFTVNEAGGELDIGLQGAAAFGINGLFDISFGAVHYACLAAKLSGGELSGGSGNNDHWHSCVIQQNNVTLPACLSGTLGYMYSWKADVDLVGIFSKGIQINLITAARHAVPWYRSLIFNDGGMNKKCPHLGERVDVTVVDSYGNPLLYADVLYEPASTPYSYKSTGRTDGSGRVSLYACGNSGSGSGIPYKVTARWNHPKYGILEGSSMMEVGSDPVSVTVTVPTDEVNIRFFTALGSLEASNMPADDTVGPGRTTYTVPDQIPYLDYLDFVGWSRESGSTEATVFPGDTVPVFRDQEINPFYAVWTRTQYKIEYDANGGSEAPQPQFKYPTEAVQLSYATPVREGYTFLGWSEDPGSEIPDHFPGERYDEDASLKLYAVWQIIPMIPCRIVYHANADGDSSAVAPAPQFAIPGTVLFLRTEEPVREGPWLFLGWNPDPDPDDGMPTLLPGQSLTVTEDITLYAVWQLLPSTPCKITYDANATGDSSATAPAPQFALPGTTVVLRENAPLREGPYLFLGWNPDPDPDDGMPSLLPGQSLTVTEDITLYAVWQLLPSTPCKITYDANAAGDSSATAPAPQFALPGTAVVLRENEPVREGPYLFLGWNPDPDPDDGMPSLLPGQSYTVSEDITLYAVWQYLPSTPCRITYDANANGDQSASAPLPQFAAFGSSIQLCNTGATWDDLHIFLGWNTDPDPDDGMPSFLPGQKYTVTGDVTLYAIWQIAPVLTYRVSYDPLPGTGGPDTQFQSEKRTLTLSPVLPAYEAHRLAGWRSSADGGLWQPGDCYPLRVSTVMTAEWEPDYRILEGNGSTRVQQSGTELTFRANGPANLFRHLLIDGESVTAKDHYSIRSGSTVCVLSAGYLDSLKAGPHTICFVYGDGQTETGHFTLESPKPYPPTGDSGAPVLLFTLSVSAFCLLLSGRRAKSKR